jgi:hypothetical protein
MKDLRGRLAWILVRAGVAEPVVPGTVEAEAGGSLEHWSSRPAWATQQNPISKKRKKKKKEEGDRRTRVRERGVM